MNEFKRPVWSAKTAAEFFGVSVQAVYDMRDNGILKQLEKLPGVKFRKADCLAVANETEDVFRPYEVAKMRRELVLEKKKNATLTALLYKIGSEVLTEIAITGGENGRTGETNRGVCTAPSKRF